MPPPMLWPSTTRLSAGMRGGRDADEGVEVVGVLRDVPQVDPLAAGPAVAAEVQGVGDEPGLAEPLRDVVVAAGVFGVAVGQHDHTARVGLRGPHVVDDADAADAVEAAFAAGSGHQGRLAGGPNRLGAVLSDPLRKLDEVSVLAELEPRRRRAPKTPSWPMPSATGASCWRTATG